MRLHLSKIKSHWFVVFITALILLRLALPIIIKNYTEEQLNNIDGYKFKIESLDLVLILGRAAFNDIKVIKQDYPSATPTILNAKSIVLDVSWLGLFRGVLIGDIHVNSPTINLITVPSHAGEKASKKSRADNTNEKKPAKPDLASLIPFRIDGFHVRNGHVVYKNPQILEQSHFEVKDITLDIRNITNSQKISDTLVATIEMTATTTGQGQFQLETKFNPTASLPYFELRTKLLNLELKALNKITRHFGQFDFERGQTDLVVEAKVRDGQIEGYIKPLFVDVKVIGPEDKTRDQDSLLRRIWESLVGGAEEVVQNQPIAQSGAKIPFKGKLDENNISTREAIVSVLRNAFVKALLPNYEYSH